MANFVSESNMTSIMTALASKINAVNGAYIAKGSSAFASLPSTLTKAMTGYVYNVSDEFTTDSRFVEGTGKKYSAGTNVVVVNVGTASTPDMKFDVISAFVDVDALTAAIAAVGTRVGNVDGAIADAFSTSQAYSVGDVVMYQDKLYKFKASHAAGAWSASDVDAITVESLVDNAEPNELTTAEVNALIALLN